VSTQPIILAAVDMDRRAIAVIERAARLAALCQGHLILAHAVDWSGTAPGDCPFPERPGQVQGAMVRHARASLVGMVNGLDLPNDWVEILVETGPAVETLTRLIAARGAAYCLMGRPRLGALGAALGVGAGLAAALRARGGCEPIEVQAKPLARFGLGPARTGEQSPAGRGQAQTRWGLFQRRL
jgi:nucleotide-binding universal stress UspA family protein